MLRSGRTVTGTCFPPARPTSPALRQHGPPTAHAGASGLHPLWIRRPSGPGGGAGRGDMGTERVSSACLDTLS